MQTAFTAPDVFVIGAAKAASSSLQRWLGDHPQIGTSRIDETRFLMDAEDPLSRPDGHAVRGLAGYGAYFPAERRSGDCRHVLDVTPMYYYQRTAREVIPDLPGSRAIFIARRPSERLMSLYTYAQNNISVLPKTISFAGFLAEIEKGAASQVVGGYPMMRDALQHCRYAQYLRDWQGAMGPDRLKVLIFEEVTADPAATLRDLARWLGIDAGFYDSYAFPRENQSFTVRSQRLHKLARKMRQHLPAALTAPLKGYYRQANASGGLPARSAEDRAAMARIDALLWTDEQDLAALIGRARVWSPPVPAEPAADAVR